uniref:Uncharacterized protein n=1 Tax=Glossina austeni TaxID=7395 RepID=A0A1A9VS27_GLOAU
MRNLVVYLLIFGLYAMQTVVGHMNSDPAPGRSPGPPMIIATQAELTNTAEDTQLAAAHYDDIKTNITAAIKTTKQPTHYHHQQKQYSNNANLPNASSLGKDLPSVEGTVHQADDDAINFRLAKSENNYMTVNDNVDIANVEVIDDDNNDSDENENENENEDEDATVSFVEDVEMTANIDYNATQDKLNHYVAEAEQKEENVFSTSTSTSRTVHSSPSMQSSACASQLSDFLNDVPVIDALDITDQANSTSIPQGLQIQLELLHDIFDTTTTNFGINCGLMYKAKRKISKCTYFDGNDTLSGRGGSTTVAVLEQCRSERKYKNKPHNTLKQSNTQNENKQNQLPIISCQFKHKHTHPRTSS